MAMFNSYVTVYQRVTGFVSSPFTEIEHGWTWDVQANPVAGGNLCEPCHPAPCTGTRLFWLERSAALQPNEGPQPYPLVDHSCWTWAPNMGQIASPALGHIPRTSTSTIHQDRVGLGVFGGITQFYKSKFIPLIPQSSVGRLPMPNCPCSEEPQT